MRPALTTVIRHGLLALSCAVLAACGSVRYEPIKTISEANFDEGYRLYDSILRRDELTFNNRTSDKLFVIMTLSGGGTRAAALGYGVLEEMAQNQITLDDKKTTLFNEVDLVFGISGGAILAAYFGLHGPDTLGYFEKNFLRQNLQGILKRQLFAIPNLSRLTSPEFGRGDLLEEQLDQALFKGKTYQSMISDRKGPFTVISATDMASGNRLDFTQEAFDLMCLDLADMPIARAVAASSSVPLVFAPLTLNNNGGNCTYKNVPEMLQQLEQAEQQKTTLFRAQTRREMIRDLRQYANSDKRPYIHLIDGGLTDNLGLRSLLDMTNLFSRDYLYDVLDQGTAQSIVIINVNAQNELSQQIDQTANIPTMAQVVNSLVNIPIDKYSQESERQFRVLVDTFKEEQQRQAQLKGTPPVEIYYISLALKDLPNDYLREQALNIPTNLYLPNDAINQLKAAGATLLSQSKEYQRLMQALGNGPKRIQLPLAAQLVTQEAQAAAEAEAKKTSTRDAKPNVGPVKPISTDPLPVANAVEATVEAAEPAVM
ncbi:MAG: patatin-like phospholipase family protein [Neisseriaceae bacterium]|nr:patatin-like phospholipase family protein [Neisseriaceae bacterium]MBP6862284.1 patatin-like phospholipase family protein [Neisseriaceae bacterium]